MHARTGRAAALLLTVLCLLLLGSTPAQAHGGGAAFRSPVAGADVWRLDRADASRAAEHTGDEGRCRAPRRALRRGG